MKKFLTFVVVLSALFVFGNSHKVSAQEVFGCQNIDSTQLDAVVTAPVQQSDIYVRAGLKDYHQQSSLGIELIESDEYAGCLNIGSVKLSDKWQKIGTLPDVAKDQIITLTLLVGSYNFDLSAGGPELMFVSKNPPCKLEEKCIVRYGGADFELSPKKISLSSDTLKAGLLMDPSKDKINNVIYSINGAQVYSKKNLEPFNLRYVPGGSSSIERTVVLSSGQSLSDQRIVEKGTIGDVGYLFTAILVRYSKLLYFVLSIISFALIWILVIFFVRLRRRRKLWMLYHVAGEQIEFDETSVGPQSIDKFEESNLDFIAKHKLLFFIPLGIIVAGFVSFSFVLSVFTVDGVSMYPTLENRSKQPLFVLPAVFGKITGNGYTPTRGSIVVISKDENNLFTDDKVQQKSYVVKRVVALPEERVVIKDGIITVYNKEFPEGFVPDNEYKWISDLKGSESIKMDVTIKAGELFVIGDNRDESIDSRYYGSIHATDVIGKVIN